MPSAVIRDWAYDEARNELTVAFVSGKVYVYSLVPPSVAEAMRGAVSKGAYFNENIRDKYGYHRIGRDASKAARASLLDRLKASRED